MGAETGLNRIFYTDEKIFRFPGRLHAWKQGRIPKPVSCEIQITNRCNQRCSYCMFKHDNAEMSLPFAKSCLTQLAQLGCKGINFSGGGEPTLHPHLPELLIHAKSAGLDVGLITNGQRITDEIAIVATDICEWVRVSLSATTRDSYKRIRGVDGLDSVKNGIRRLVESKRLNNANCTIGVQWIYTGMDRVFDLETFIDDFLKPAGVDYLQVIPEQSFDPTVQAAQLCLRDIYRQLNRQDGFQILPSKLDRIGAPRSYSRCHGSWFFVLVAPNGDVHICCHYHDVDGVLGNLHTSSLNDIWYSESHRKVVDSIDISLCLPLCKHDRLNRTLEAIQGESLHENFL